jgi:hypothetical protein
MIEEYERIVADARRVVARGSAIDVAAFERRIRAVGGGGGEEQALRQLAAVVAVHRARSRFVEPVEPNATPAPGPLRVLRTRPTISGSLDMRRDGEFVLAWPRDRDVETWEVRIAERPDVRSDYVVRDERELAGELAELELPLGDLPMRVHVVGRGRGGRLVRRAVLTGVTRETWNDRWQRR